MFVDIIIGDPIAHCANSLERRSQGRRDPESLGVEISSDLHRVAGLPLIDVLVRRALYQERVLAFARPHPSYSLLVRLDEYVLMRVHKFPHLAVEIYLRFLQKERCDINRGILLVVPNSRCESAFWKFNRHWNNLKLHSEIRLERRSRTNILTRKKSHVAPWARVPYWTSVCDARSSGELIGVTILSMVKNAARLAV